MGDEREPFEEAALYVTDKELRRRVNPRMGWDKFRAAVRDAEKTASCGSGLVFPRVSALWGGRYWPKAKAYFDDDEGLDQDEFTGADDKPENFRASNATARQTTRPQNRPQRAALLDREERGARPDGLSRPVHRIAGGR